MGEQKPSLVLEKSYIRIWLCSTNPEVAKAGVSKEMKRGL